MHDTSFRELSINAVTTLNKCFYNAIFRTLRKSLSDEISIFYLQGQIGMFIKANDVDIGREDFIDNFVAFIYIKPAPNKSRGKYTQAKISAKVSSLIYSSMVYCADDYYGSNCGIYCKSEKNSHYNCNNKGEKICQNLYKILRYS